MNPESVPSAIAKVLDRLILPAGSVLLAAYSGGPDSTALLASLAVASRLRGWSVRALHVDHNLRPQDERQTERLLVQSVCSRLGTALTIARIASGAIGRLAAEKKSGIEEAARIYRYAAIRICGKRHDISAIFLGHTLDDQLETVLMRTFGGSSAGGLKGMPAESGIIWRPFLSCAKTDILAYLEKNQLPYSTDSTNVSDDFTRNKIRHRLIPALDQTIPGWKGALSLSSQKAKLDENAFSFFSALSPGRFCIETDRRRSADAAAFNSEPEALRIRMLLEACSAISGRIRLSWRMAATAIHILEMKKKIFKGGGFSIWFEGDRLILEYGLDFPVCGGYFVEVSNLGEYRAGKFRLKIAWRTGNSVQGLREGSFSFPLVIRSRVPGDCIVTERGTKKLDDLFAEWKIPQKSRDTIPVAEDRKGIVAVLGLDAGGKNRFRSCSDFRKIDLSVTENSERPAGTGRILSILLKGVRVSDGF